MTDPTAKLDSLMGEIRKINVPIKTTKAIDYTEASNTYRQQLRKKGGLQTSINFTPKAHAIVKWCKTTPGHPRTAGRICEAALELYEAHHRGGAEVRRIVSEEALEKLDKMLVDRPGLTEGELMDLAIRHLWHSFSTSPDGMVDT